MNLSSASTRVRALIGDPNGRAVHESEVTAAINSAISWMQRESGALELRFPLLLEAGVRLYDLDDDVDEVFRVMFNGYPLPAIPQSHLASIDPLYTTRTGTYPEAYYLDGLNHQIGLYPVPSTGTTTHEDESGYGVIVGGGGLEIDGDYGFAISDGTEGIEIDGVYGTVASIVSSTAGYIFAKVSPPALSSSTDEIQLPTWCHQFVCFAAAAEIMERDSDFANQAAAVDYMALAKYCVDRLTIYGEGGLGAPICVGWREESPRVDMSKFRRPRIINP